MIIQQQLQAGREWYNLCKVIKGKTLQPRISYPARFSSRFDGQIKNFTDKQKLKEFSTNKTSFTTNVDGTSLGKKERARTRNKKLWKETIYHKGKYTVKEGKYPHTKPVERLKDKNSNSTCVYNKQVKDTKIIRCKWWSQKTVIMRGGVQMQGGVFKMHLKWRDQPLKTITLIYTLLYENLMVTANPNWILDIHAKKKKQSIRTLKIVIKS